MRAVLTFHSVDASGSVLSIAPSELSSMLDAIATSGHNIVSLKELLVDPGQKDCVALTFDDGYSSTYVEAYPILRQAGTAATVFLTTGYVGKNNGWPTLPAGAPLLPLMDWPQVEELNDAGWTIGAHTATHPDLRQLDDGQIEAEITHSNEAILSRLGERPEVFAYPYGSFDARVEAWAAHHYRFSVTTQMGTLPRRKSEPHRIPRIETYYIRPARIHSGFGHLPFHAYLRARTLLRRLRRLRRP